MEKELDLSLCIPTNGIQEWVVPVIESIYSQENDNNDFEVIVTDNGENLEFQTKMHEYENRYSNFIYKKTESVMFLNQIEAFKLATGKLIKFVNHRMIMLPGALEYLINFSKENCTEMPSVYFSNGVLRLIPVSKICDNFDIYVKTLKNFSSWSAGTAIWKKEFEKIDLNKEFDSLFPHIDIIFSNKNSKMYIVDDTQLMEAIPSNSVKKGKYDLFFAFAIHYMDIIHKLYENGNIALKTYEYIRKQNGKAIAGWYFDFVIRKEPCSYDLSGYKAAIGKYYSDIEIKINLVINIIQRMLGKIKKIF